MKNVTERPPIPSQLEREVKMETGYRCAIPACRQNPVEIAHIIPWEKVQEHTFDNLIALCPTCHARYDYTKEIDRKAMLQYKTNLSVVNGRYCDLEQRILRHFANNPDDAASNKSTRSIRIGGVEISTDDNQESISKDETPKELSNTAPYGNEINILGGLEILLMNLLEDGFLADTGKNSGVILADIPSYRVYRLTAKGRDFINRWNKNSPLD
jgi:hypothetical protein